MVTLVIALLGALALGLSFEGTVKLPGLLAGCTFAQVGRVRLGFVTFRPGRVYLRLEATR